MKNLIISSGMACMVWLMQSCGGNSASTTSGDSTITANADSSKNMVDTTHKMADTTSAMKMSPGPISKMDTLFTSKAAMGGMMEVELGKLAQTKAMDQRVKDFGTMMVTDHTQANNDLMQRAASQNIMLPTGMSSDEQKEMDKLSKKSGADFDKAYMNMMLDDHKKDITEFRKAADKATNPSIKDFATKTLPTLEKHLDSAKAITKKS